MRHIPNLICLLRIALILPLVLAMRAGQQERIIVLFSIAAVSDGLDGYLAKRFGWTSDLGRVLDPVADKLLLVSVFITASWLGIAPWWLTVAAVLRDFVIGFGAILYRLWLGPLNGRPSVISKINTTLQLAYLLAVFVASATGFPPRELLDALAVVLGVTIAASGTDYVLRYLRRARAALQALRAPGAA
jgi:cardiolipin synthase